jgi:hypothetical protein
MKKILSVCSPRVLFAGYAGVGFLMFLYSFTQVDLGLTLTQFSFWQIIQKNFQYIGYFQRPFSTVAYCILVIGLLILYGYAMRCIKNNRISMQSLKILIFSIFCLLVLSYPAFSYDFFNYMFTAKTVLLYGKNPYQTIPLQFTGFEPWLSFMHWTHLPSAYAPVWILLTLPAYIFSFGYFLLILWNLKITIGIFYLLTAWGIGQILRDDTETNRLSGIALFALNPLILIESLVSGHNDIVMAACAIAALLVLWKKNYVYSFFIFALSVALKEITIILAPLYFLRKNRFLPFLLMSVGLISFLIFFKREMLPWYGIWVLPFAALVPNITFYMPLVYGFSSGLLLYYAPFLYFGHWNDPVPVMKFWLTILPMVIACLYMVTKRFCFYIREKH